MLHLKLPTDPRWVNLAEMSIEDILTDHAYCEQKAASTCISIIQQFPEHEKAVEEIAPIVTEEWGHFRQVLAELKRRNLKLGIQRKDVYVNQLMVLKRKGGPRLERFLDMVLISALIEARSCERFRLLSEGLTDPYMREFYRKFMISEAGHYRLFLDLAKTYCKESVVDKRWQELLDEEKKIVANLELRGDRVH